MRSAQRRRPPSSQLALAAVAALALEACGPSTQMPNANTAETHDQYVEAYNIVSAIDYLPFEYAVDGCYARSLYMSMELATQGIPSRSVFAKSTSNVPLETQDGTEWGYHVAPLIKDGSNGGETVIDPSMKAGAYLTMDQWIYDMEFSQAEIDIVSVQGSYYGSPPETADPAVDDFASLKPFNGKDIVNACNVLYNYLGSAGLNVESLAKRRAHLVQRTGELAEVLARKGKLVGAEALNGASCGGQDIEDNT